MIPTLPTAGRSAGTTAVADPSREVEMPADGSKNVHADPVDVTSPVPASPQHPQIGTVDGDPRPNAGTGCTCGGPGYCQRFKRDMSGRLFDICQSRVLTPERCAQYRRAWDEQAGNVPPVGERGGASHGGKRTCCGHAKRVRTPGLRSRALTFADAMTAFAKDRFRIASAAAQEERRETCATCPLNSEGMCSACGCWIAAKLKPRLSQCPAYRWFPDLHSVFPGGRRHMLYHILPVANNGVWEWNVKQLLRRIEIFDGVRSIAVATGEFRDEPLVAPDEVRGMFDGHRVDHWIVKPNVVKRREVETFHELMATLPNEGVTWYGHGKGVTHSMQSVCIRWAEVMYQVTLDDFESVRRCLREFMFAGPFKRYGHFRTRGNHQHHYSGTFFWFRNADVFARDFRKIDGTFFGVESWPGQMCVPEETGCLFLDDCGNLYLQSYWNDVVEPQFQIWKAARNLTHTPPIERSSAAAGP